MVGWCVKCLFEDQEEERSQDRPPEAHPMLKGTKWPWSDTL